MSENTQNLPVVALVGRPNVGKSTLFNRLTRSWQAIVEDRPGITRDRLLAKARIGDHDVTLMDTGGLELTPQDLVEKKMSEQAWRGIESADLIVFLFDGRAGLTAMDEEWVRRLRKINTPKIFVVNKLDEHAQEHKMADFFGLGLDPLVGISAEHERGFAELYNQISGNLQIIQPVTVEKPAPLPFETDDVEEGELSDDRPEPPFKMAIIGRPNVGKSTLLNAFLQDERSITDDTPGTTRDPIDVIIPFGDKSYHIIDTAGIRKRAKSRERVEKFSIVKSRAVIEEADVVLLLIDGHEGPTVQDAHVAGLAFEKAKALIMIINKWDAGKEKWTREYLEERLELKMNFLSQVPMLYVSAKTGKNIERIFPLVERMRDQLERRISTSALNKAFEHIITHHPLPVYKGQQIKMFYATQGGTRPPTFLVFCNYPKQVHFSYKRYLINALKEIFEFSDVPVRVVFKSRK